MDLIGLVLSVIELVLNMLAGALGGIGHIIVYFFSLISSSGTYFGAVSPVMSIVVGMVPAPVWYVFDFVIFGSVLSAIIIRRWGA